MFNPKGRSLLILAILLVFTFVAFCFESWQFAIFWALGAISSGLVGALIADDSDNYRRWSGLAIIAVLWVVGWVATFTGHGSETYLILKFMQGVTVFMPLCAVMAYRRN